jgi:hypothetical protein
LFFYNKALSQYITRCLIQEHIYNNTWKLAWTIKWVFKLAFVENVFSHIWHMKGFSPRWIIASWRCKLSFLLKLLLQTWQWNCLVVIWLCPKSDQPSLFVTYLDASAAISERDKQIKFFFNKLLLSPSAFSLCYDMKFLKTFMYTNFGLGQNKLYHSTVKWSIQTRILDFLNHKPEGLACISFT